MTAVQTASAELTVPKPPAQSTADFVTQLNSNAEFKAEVEPEAKSAIDSATR